MLLSCVEQGPGTLPNSRSAASPTQTHLHPVVELPGDAAGTWEGVLRLAHRVKVEAFLH